VGSYPGKSVGGFGKNPREDVVEMELYPRDKKMITLFLLQFKGIFLHGRL